MLSSPCPERQKKSCSFASQYPKPGVKCVYCGDVVTGGVSRDEAWLVWQEQWDKGIAAGKALQAGIRERGEKKYADTD